VAVGECVCPAHLGYRGWKVVEFCRNRVVWLDRKRLAQGVPPIFTRAIGRRHPVHGGGSLYKWSNLSSSKA
jgi:hypothetical protein